MFVALGLSFASDCCCPSGNWASILFALCNLDELVTPCAATFKHYAAPKVEPILPISFFPCCHTSQAPLRFRLTCPCPRVKVKLQVQNNIHVYYESSNCYVEPSGALLMNDETFNMSLDAKSRIILFFILLPFSTYLNHEKCVLLRIRCMALFIRGYLFSFGVTMQINQEILQLFLGMWSIHQIKL